MNARDLCGPTRRSGTRSDRTHRGGRVSGPAARDRAVALRDEQSARPAGSKQGAVECSMRLDCRAIHCVRWHVGNWAAAVRESLVGIAAAAAPGSWHISRDAAPPVDGRRGANRIEGKAEFTRHMIRMRHHRESSDGCRRGPVLAAGRGSGGGPPRSRHPSPRAWVRRAPRQGVAAPGCARP